jgi:hypothetical protein
MQITARRVSEGRYIDRYQHKLRSACLEMCGWGIGAYGYDEKDLGIVIDKLVSEKEFETAAGYCVFHLFSFQRAIDVLRESKGKSQYTVDKY